MSLTQFLQLFPRPTKSSQRKPRRLEVEPLEGRWVPTTVTTLSDGVPGSLRDAIASTPANGTVDFQSGLSGTIALTGGTLVLDHNLTIAGPGANVITVSGNHEFEVFSIPAGVTAAVSGLTVADGFTTTSGGGISNAGTLTLTDSMVLGNVANNSAFVFSETTGGGIFNSGMLTVTNCTIAFNQVKISGGGIANTGTLSITNSTVAGNTGTGGSPRVVGTGGPPASLGDGIDNVAGALTVLNCTVAGNRDGGIETRGGGTVYLTNTLVAGNTFTQQPQSDVVGNITGAVNNLIGVIFYRDFFTQIPFAGPNSGPNSVPDSNVADGVDGNQVGAYGQVLDPRIGPLQDNGGPTLTMALLPDSPCVNAADAAGAPTTDQRGAPRTPRPFIDVGAFEYQGAVGALTPNQRYVIQLFHDVLARSPGAGGFRVWVHALDAGALTRFQAAYQMWVSPEYLGLQVDHAYLAFLHRADTLRERSAWLDALRAGSVKDNDLPLLFVTSREYNDGHPGNQDYVLGLFNDFLIRRGSVSADDAGQWRGQLDSGALSRAQVAALFGGSSEALDVAINGLYQTFLRRLESASELYEWFQAIAGGRIEGHVAAALFLSSDEYYQKAGSFSS